MLDCMDRKTSHDISRIKSLPLTLACFPEKPVMRGPRVCPVNKGLWVAAWGSLGGELLSHEVIDRG